jgi:hypothetical protein
MGESLDNRIARELTPGREPLALYAGRKSGYIDDNLSFRGPKQLRAAENNPWNAYSRLVGLGNAAGDPELAKKLVARRRSINDLLRTQIRDVTGRADLSAEDRRRIDLHLSSVRDIELALIKQLPPDAIAPLKAMDGKHRDPVNMEAVMRLQMDLLAFALASDYARTATLQIGDGNDSTQYVIGGEKLPSFHQISHRIFSDGAEGAPIPLAVEMHHKIDRLHARAFKYLVDKVAAYSVPGGGTLLDDSFLVWTNSLANGPPHSYEGVPYVIAGSAGGYLKQGSVVSVANDPATKKKTTNNKLFNTLLAAAGVRKEGGAPVDDFGDPSLPKGGIAELVAG